MASPDSKEEIRKRINALNLMMLDADISTRSPLDDFCKENDIDRRDDIAMIPYGTALGSIAQTQVLAEREKSGKNM